MVEGTRPGLTLPEAAQPGDRCNKVVPMVSTPQRPTSCMAGGTVKLSALGRPSWQAEGDVGASLKPRRQPR